MMVEKLYLKPSSISEAMEYAKSHLNDFRFLAGGTDVIVNKFQNNDESSCLIDLTGIEELKKIVVEEDFLKIGSLVRLDDLKKNTEIGVSFPALLQAAHSVASPLLRKTATLGGNLLCENRCTFYNQSEWWREAVGYCLKCDGDVCIATGGKKACFSKFVSDMAPVLISMEAQIEIADGEEIRTVPLETIYTGDGVNSIQLPKTAIIRYIVLPLNRNFKTAFKKLRPREAVDFTSLTTAVTISNSGSLRIVIGGVDPKPVLFQGALSDNLEELMKKAVKKPRVVDNDFYSRTYRREMMEVFLQQSFKELINQNLNYE
ncbi:MAG: FAD binding domain-containing protein [Bacteroidetes bacterium]|nr:FAD binding domain-containing protein [Bacteroidota bacterium]